MSEFNSIAEEIRYHAREFMKDGAEYAAKDVKAYVKANMKDQVSDGAFAGAIRDLMQKEDQYVVVRRGFYKFTGDSERQNRMVYSKDNPFLDLSISMLNQTLRDIGDKLKEEVNILELGNDEIRQIQDVKKLVEDVKAIVEKHSGHE
ncbi:hypothetical protein KD909_03055 [Exiguobacterium sp. PFWT01]|uniref:hypothetical protein n=1 Tax=Exiguobacterium sp. PFWT01 TaxID=2829816 RepID=UPI001BA95879|nr:hypothetical protein [Exiguobacterium sp. PFWT01]QUP87728.1 hypothetical protein KD909_03055 [Exiguobacterium sp. PFWT01]